MNIGQAAAASGVSAKMIRHYEKIGLLEAAARRGNGYRSYSSRDIRILRFIRRARDLGFSLKETENLLTLWQRRDGPSRDVKQLALQHITSLEGRLEEMKAMIATLRHLADACHGDDRPECPILADLSGQPCH